MNSLSAESARGATLETAGDESIVSHSHYYDAALHRAITETGEVDGRRTLERAAASAAFRAVAGGSPASAAAEITGLFESTDLGAIQKCEVSAAGATITVAPSSFVRARLEMFGKASKPACDVSRGVLAGTLGALFGSTYRVKEVECVATGAKSCKFVAEPEVGPAGRLELPPFEWPGRGLSPEPDFVPGLNVIEQVAGQDAGAPSGRLWAELYARASHEFEVEVPAAMGAKFNNLASIVLTEASHLGTFYSVGGLVRSDAWQERVVPVMPSREEWVHAIVALVESFGWGAWRIRLLAPQQRFTVQVHDGYEALSYLALNGAPATSPRCYFSRGFVGGLMNILFAGDVMTPRALDQKVYNMLFRSPYSFRAIETRCQAMGDPFCEFVANPLSPGLLRKAL